MRVFDYLQRPVRPLLIENSHASNPVYFDLGHHGYVLLPLLSTSSSIIQVFAYTCILKALDYGMRLTDAKL